MIVIISIESTARRARRLTEVLPTVLLPDSFLLWKAQFLANCSTYLCHMVLRRPPRYQGRQRVIESRLARLSTQAEILKSNAWKAKSRRQRREVDARDAHPTAAATRIAFRPSQINRPPFCATTAILFINTLFTAPVIIQVVYFYFQSESYSTSAGKILGRSLGHPPTSPSDCDDCILCAMRACSTNLTTETVRSPHSAQTLPYPADGCSYVWKRCPMI